MASRNHNWTKEDNIVALYYYRFGTQHLGVDEKDIVSIIGTTVASLKMQSKNFEMLDTGRSGLSDYSEIQSEVFNEFGTVSRYILYKEVKKALNLDNYITQKIVKSKFGHRRLRPVTA